jgi:hypothetical protein
MEATFHDAINGLEKKTLKKRMLDESSRNQTLWLHMFTYESVESRKQYESNKSHLPRHDY